MIIRIFAAVLFLFGARGGAATLTDGDRAFDKHLFEEALKIYAPIAKDPKVKGDTHLKAVFRAAESEALLYRYGEAAQRVHAEVLPSAPLWKARLLFLRAELAREFVKQYAYGSPRDREEGATDLTKRTPEEWHAEIRKSFEALWALRASLVPVMLKEEAYFIELERADLEAVPTFFDLVVARWTEYLLAEASTEEADEPAGESFLAGSYKGSVGPKESGIRLAAAIYEAAHETSGKGRAAARELWRIERFMLPFRYPNKVEKEEDAKAFSTRGA